MRTRGRGVEPIGEILRFVGHQSVAEFHDAHRVRRYAVIGQYELGDPEIAAADHSPDRKTLLVWLDESALLNVAPAADPLARLRIIKHSIVVVDFVFDLESACVRSIPMALQRRPRVSFPHRNPPPALPAIIRGENGDVGALNGPASQCERRTWPAHDPKRNMWRFANGTSARSRRAVGPV